jgi:hypothetical protein
MTGFDVSPKPVDNKIFIALDRKPALIKASACTFTLSDEKAVGRRGLVTAIE